MKTGSVKSLKIVLLYILKLGNETCINTISIGSFVNFTPLHGAKSHGISSVTYGKTLFFNPVLNNPSIYRSSQHINQAKRRLTPSQLFIGSSCHAFLCPCFYFSSFSFLKDWLQYHQHSDRLLHPPQNRMVHTPHQYQE